MDLHSKKVIGFSIATSMTTQLVMDALDNATLNNCPKNVILHSDLGSQYTSQTYQDQVKEHEMYQSFSRKGCPYDNASIESFHASLKKEEVFHHHYLNFKAAKESVFKYIESGYNRQRINSSIGYLTPEAFELQSKAVG
ncbi:Transposase [Enterococcus sp. 5H]|nr:Transposase [Enterococcus sp. 5H]